MERLPSELYPLICKHMDKSSLFAFALVASGFVEPALDGLWREIDSFKPIMATLSTNLWKVVETPSLKEISDLHPPFINIYHLLRPLFPRDVNRYTSYYAHRIRSVILTRPLHLPSESFLQALGRVSPKLGSFSPNLCHFDCDPWFIARVLDYDMAKAADPIARLFPGRHTVSYRLTGLAEGPLWWNILQSTFPLLSSLTELRLLDIDSTQTASLFQTHFHILRNLVTLEMCKVSAPFIPQIAALPHLKELDLELGSIPFRYNPATGPIPWDDREDVCTSRMPTRGFASLQVLMLDSKTLNHAAGFLQHIPSSNRLRRLEIRSSKITAPVSNREAQSLLQVIDRHCNPRVLEYLHIDDDDTGVFSCKDDLGVLPIPLDLLVDLSPLYPFHNLIVLRVRFNVGIKLDATSGMLVAHSWPRLLELDFDGTREHTKSRPPALDHISILTIAKGCPALQRMRIAFDASQIPSSEYQLGAKGKGKQAVKPSTVISLSSLSIGDNFPIKSSANVATFLQANFPKLKKVQVAMASEYRGKYSSRWMEVVSNLRRKNQN